MFMHHPCRTERPQAAGSVSFRRSGPDVVDHVSMDADPVSARLGSEFDFMQCLGGPSWSQTYIQPFYMKMPSGVPEDADDVAALLPRLSTLALELTSDDVASMLKMQWRIQCVAAWLAIARCDVLTRYRDRAIANEWEVAGSVVDAALQRLSGGAPHELPTPAQQRLEILLSRAQRLQALAD
jgi:hypothetical protein